MGILNVLSRHFKILIISFLFCSAINAQYLGVTVDANSPIIGKNPLAVYIPTGISLLFGYEVIDNLNIEGRFGMCGIVYEYQGLDITLMTSYKVIGPFYISALASHHANSGVEEEGSQNKSIMLYGVGAGADILKWLSFEVAYLKTLQSEPWLQYYHYWKGGFWWSNLNGVIRASVKFHWAVR